jgi:ABC-2 type transport system ATP-binding protein
MNTETFVLNLREALIEAPDLTGYPALLSDPYTLEVELSRGQSLNDIFLRLSQLGIHVVSMRNKVNRLEEIFMRLVEGKAQPATRAAG